MTIERSEQASHPRPGAGGVTGNSRSTAPRPWSRMAMQGHPWNGGWGAINLLLRSMPLAAPPLRCEH